MQPDLDLVFKALADPARLRILEFLRQPDAECCSVEGRVCACDVESVLGLAQATVSHHMKCLLKAGLVEGEKRGRWMHYRLNHEAFAEAARRLDAFARDAKAACRARAAA